MGAATSTKSKTTKSDASKIKTKDSDDQPSIEELQAMLAQALEENLKLSTNANKDKIILDLDCPW